MTRRGSDGTEETAETLPIVGEREIGIDIGTDFERLVQLATEEVNK